MEDQIQKLQTWFENNKKPSLVAISGGIDSMLVAALARKFWDRASVLAVISASASVKKDDVQATKDFCSLFDLELLIADAKEYLSQDYLKNAPDRCYHCKSALYELLTSISQKTHYTQILNGQNADDLSDYRPGLKAADEAGIRAPLAECQITKDEVRSIARSLDIPYWDKPASPCLSSRIPYGERVSIEKLSRIEQAEAFLIKNGFNIIRVRHFGDAARIEVDQSQIKRLENIMTVVTKFFTKLGFSHVQIDQGGFQSGNLNKLAGIK